METEKTLVLEFFDEDNGSKSLVIKNPKENLLKEDVSEVMGTIIENDVLLTNKGKHLVDVKNCYYRTVTKEDLATNQISE